MSHLREYRYHFRTFWLFIYSDSKTIILPSTLFGIANAEAASRYGITLAHPIIHGNALARVPLVLCWVVVNFAPFVINNQSTRASIVEDTINKPWRPLPSGRLSPAHANAVIYPLYVAAQLFNALIGLGTRQGMILVPLGAWYNNYGGGDGGPVTRSTINALGYLCFISGALEVAMGAELSFHDNGVFTRWLCVIAGIVLTTVHTQDLYDQKGDAARGRLTLPLAIGDMWARWVLVFWMLVWGFVCPFFWGKGLYISLLSVAMALCICCRTVRYRDESSDRATFVVWNIWMSFVYILPLL
ncbi:hypothetical protein F5Y19DRAFT_417020 [Xylariaceae sp. FL1651]|nr:hypothetical protein F5Y19DRAFT_417020 [Xylariaceae sp. FL1651]